MNESEAVAAVEAAARKLIEETCLYEAPFPMPLRAQSLHQRVGYACCLPKGHDEAHKWGDWYWWTAQRKPEDECGCQIGFFVLVTCPFHGDMARLLGGRRDGR